MPGASSQWLWGAEKRWGAAPVPEVWDSSLQQRQHPSPRGSPAPWGSGRGVLGTVGSPWGHGIPLGLWDPLFGAVGCGFPGFTAPLQPAESGSSSSTRPRSHAQDLGGPPGGALHPQKGPPGVPWGAQRERGHPGGGRRGRAGPPWRGQSRAARPLQPFPRGRPSLGFFRIVLEVLENFADCLNGFN